MSQSDNLLLQTAVTRLEALTGLNVDLMGASNNRLLQHLVTLLAALDPGTGTPGISPARLPLTVTTPQLAPGASHLFTLVTGYRTFALVNVSVDAPARAQGYRTVAARTTDEGRPFTTPPDPLTREPKIDVNLIAGALSQAGAGLIGLEPNGTLYGRLTNTGTVAAELTLQLEILPLEEINQL